MTNEESYFPESGVAATACEERRRAERYPCSLQPFWRVEGQEQAESPPARVENVSTSGIGLRVGEPLKVGIVLVLKLQTADRRLSRPLPARVMHSTRQPGGDWLVGCQFVRKLSDEDMHALLDAG
jgi:hypothetical protein